MIPIQAPIKRGQQGPEVANLQEALLFMLDKQTLNIKPDQVTFLHAGLLQEKLKQIYSDYTAKTVETLQGLLGVDRTSEVDERTADALNKLLRDAGAFGDAGTADVVRALEAQSQTLQAIDQDTDHLANIESKLGDLAPPPSRKRLVSGQVSRDDDQPAQGVTVRALDVNERATIRLGDGQTDDQGRYAIRYELLPGSDGISLRVVVLDAAGKTVTASEIVSPAGAVEVIDLALPMIEPDAATRRVDGRLLFDHGLPAPDVTLRLYQLGFGGAENATRLAETITGAHGVYNLPYAAQGAANLEVRAVDANGQEVSLSKIVRNAAEREVIHLVVPAAVQPAAAEFTRLTTDVQPYVGEISRLASAQENSEFTDLSVLHENTGWDARLIAMASSATKLSAADETGLPADALYGLLRAGLPSDKLHLARVSREAFDQALSKARATGIVSLSDPQVAQLKADFDTFSVNTRLAMQAPGSRATYGDMLKTLDLSTDDQQTFAKIYLNHRGDPAALWQAATDAGLGASVPKLQQQGKLAFLTTNNPDLTAKLQADLGADDPKQLVTMGLYKSSAWLDKIDSVPAAFANKPSYAEDLARRVRISYSTEVTWHMIETEDLKIEGQGFPATVGTFLKNAITKGFKLGQMPVEQFIRANPAVLDDIPADQVASTKQMVKSLQRVYQITPGNDAMKALLNEGLTSAQDVLAYPLDVFLERFGPLFPSPEQAELVYRKAEQVSNVTTSLFTLARELENAPPVFAMSASSEVREGVRNELIQRFPTLESLFGSLDFCECEQCRSVLSPAAYLVDLLQFLDHEPKVWENFLRDWKTKHGSAPYPFKNSAAFADAGSPPNTERTPYDILSERRPDLSNIPLTCENTQTALPHIDLVNEILEYYVAHNALQADAAKDTGDATTPELLAEPQNIEPQAYAALLKARYPLTLPFDLWLETARQFCAYFETPLWQLLETFRTGDGLFAPAQPYDRAATFIESLGLSSAEVAIFTDPQPLDTWFELYGYPSEAAALTVASDPSSGQRIDLNSAKALARRLGVSYTDLVAIIRTSFVNPALDALVILHKLGIAIDDVVFFRAHQTIYEQNKDLVGKPRSTLAPADQARYDALSKQEWNDVHEAHAFVQNLAGLKKQFPSFDADDWLNNQLPNLAFDTILVLADPDAGCDFDQTTLQYADGVTPVDPAALLRINLFVRLWRKLGWTIEETDRALFTFVPKNTPFTAAHFNQQPLRTALIYLAHLKALDAQVKVGKQSRQKLLALWTDLATTGKNPLYAQLFLTRSVLKTDPIFDDALGHYLTQAGLFITDHLLALQGALGVTADEIGRTLADNGLDVTSAPLSLANVSLLYRYGMLAKALKLSVADVIALKQLSGLNPFTPLPADPLAQLADDVPFSQSLRFVEIVAQVKESGLSVADLEYLLRQRFDPAGKYRPNAEATLTLTKALAEGIRAIQREHAVPSDAGALSDEVLRQKLGMALPADLVERFLAMLNGTVEFTTTQSGVQALDQLALASFAGEPAIRALGYSAPRLEQSLTLRGVLFDDQKNQLKATFAASLTVVQQAIFAALLDDAQAQARAFFAKYLQKQAVNATVNNGFLEASDFDLLFAPAADGLTETQQQTRLRDQRARLATTFLPFLQARLTRQLVVQTMTAATGADAALIEALLTNPALLADPTQSGQPLLDAFAGGAERGLTASFFAAPDLTGPETQLLYAEANTGLRDQANTLIRPINSNSARFQGYLEVPTAGAYRFFAVLDKQNATAELRFDHLLTPVFSGLAAQDGDELGKAAGEFVELKPGVPYRFTLDVQQFGGGEARLLVQGETLPKDGLVRLTLYPDAAVDRSGRAQHLLAKSLQLIQALGLNERELRYLLTHAADFDNLALSSLPTRAADDTPDKAVALFTQFLRLAGYTRLQRALAGGGDDLITIFETAKTQTLDDAYALLAQVIRREPSTVKATAQALFATPALADERALDRLWQALQIVDQLGVPVGAIVEWTQIVSAGATEPQRFAIARDLKETIKAGFEPETWQRIAQPIFDTLRQRQRDALVAHVMYQHDFERMEQLFEYFLIDPGMEPVVQTSRIRAAISAVQIFVQRCLLNLEPQVGPAAINAKHWQWMKRYRVWEANRKIFLFPENWLEPEFRDDKTHLFAELEGKLLQGDVSSDLVEDAFFNYLKKLDELARLDIVAVYCDEDALDPASNTLHVIGRTYGEPHKYFYRRYAQQMWTPWEPVSAEIEGNHIVPVIWRDRLNLFWVTFLERANPQDGTPAKPATAVADMKFGELQTAMKSTATLKLVDVQLHWSEYFQGEWSTRESGGYSASITRSVPASFNSASVFIHATKEFEDGEERAVRIHLGTPVNQSFRVVSRNSRPETAALLPRPLMPYNAPTVQANRYSGAGAFNVTFEQRIETEDDKAPIINKISASILQNGGNFTLLPCANAITIGGDEIGSLVAPLFYQDNRSNTLFIEPTFKEQTIEEWQEWVTRTPEPEVSWDLPDWWKDLPLKSVYPKYKVPKLVDRGDPVWQGQIDPRARFALDATQDWTTHSATVVQFNGELVGEAGRAGLAVMPAGTAAAAPEVQVNAGSAVAAGHTVGVIEQNDFALAGLAQAGGINVVGSSGLNSALMKNMSR